MKKVIASLIISLTALNASAYDCRSGIDHKHPSCYTVQHRGHSHGHNNHYRGNSHDHGSWVLPAIVGGIITYGIVQSVTPQPAYPPVYQQQMPAAPYGYRYQLAFDPSCNCNKYVLVPN